MTMFQLGAAAPVTKELIAARDDRPAVTVTFNAQPTPLSLRAARTAVAKILRDGEPDAVERAGDAFSAAIIRHNIVSWEGIGNVNDEPILPTPDRELRDDDGSLISVELGTISAFLAEPRLVEAADREYVLPWTRLDAEKNGSSVSVNGTTAAETQALDTATSPATPDGSADVKPTPRRARKRAPTKSTPAKRTRAKRSGS